LSRPADSALVVLDAADMRRYRSRGKQKDPHVLKGPRTWGCLDECTAEFERGNVIIRSSAETYNSLQEAKSALAGVGRQNAIRVHAARA
jgi:hypothetical protein